MRWHLFVFSIILILTAGCVQQKEVYKTGDVSVTWLGHDTFRISDGSSVVYTDPFQITRDEKADYILVSHGHFDHCDPASVERLRRNDTRIIGSISCVTQLKGLTNSIDPPLEGREYWNFKARAFWAYNVNKMDDNGEFYHKRGRDSIGIIFEMGGKKFYFAGDTDFIPEMEELAGENIDVAFLPVSGTYAMTPDEAAEAARTIKPKVVIPMHYGSIVGGDGDASKLERLLLTSGITTVILKKSAQEN